VGLSRVINLCPVKGVTTSILLSQLFYFPLFDLGLSFVLYHKHHFYRHDLERRNVFPRQYRHCTKWDFELQCIRLHGQGRLGSDAERRSHHGCCQCGAGILTHLSDRDHLLTRSSHRLALPKKQVPAPSWPSSESPLISAAMVVSPACPIPQ
jgi:hypothetical protein